MLANSKPKLSYPIYLRRYYVVVLSIISSYYTPIIVVLCKQRILNLDYYPLSMDGVHVIVYYY